MISKETIKEYGKLVAKFLGIVFLTSSLHWIFMQIYINNCISNTFAGLFTNVLTLGSPFCQFINFVQFELSKHYITIWLAVGLSLITWFITKTKQ